jgi:hypothetical protein
MNCTPAVGAVPGIVPTLTVKELYRQSSAEEKH